MKSLPNRQSKRYSSVGGRGEEQGTIQGRYHTHYLTSVRSHVD